MSQANDRLHRNVRSGLRTALLGLSKAAFGPLTTVSFTKLDDTTGVFIRASGSWVDDNLAGGDEFSTSGWAIPGNNGLWLVSEIDDLVLSVALPEGVSRTIASASAGTPVPFTAGLPRGQKDEGLAHQPVPGEPWFRESYKAGPEQRRNIGNPAYVRLDFLYLVSVFYPHGLGSDGPDSMADAVRATFYPGRVLTYNSQVITILSSSRQGFVEEPEWSSVPVSVRGFAHVTV